jgi:hypothetical protein
MSSKEAMKVGDVIHRKDMPQFKFKIVGTNRHFKDMWDVTTTTSHKKVGMIAKDDDRWEVCK